MLKYDFQRVFKAKGIDKPFAFLIKSGFSDGFATRIKNRRINKIILNMLERLCIAIGCTPNDFLEWTPDSNQSIDKNHPINELRRTDKIVDLTMTLHSLPLSKLEEIEQFIKEDKEKA